MMELKLLKGGILWDVDHKRALTDVLPYLCYECDLEEGVCFKDILALVSKTPDLYSHLLTDGPWLSEMVDEGAKPFKQEEGATLTALELYWSAEVSKYDGPDTLIDFTNLHGLGVGGPYALDFSPINSLTELPVKLNTEYKVYDIREGMADAPVFLTAQKSFTLLDILRGVFWELSFHGSIKNRDQRAADLKQSVEDLNNGLVKAIPYISVDDMLSHESCEGCDGEGWVLDNEEHRCTCSDCGGYGITPESLERTKLLKLSEPPDRDRDDSWLEED